MSLLRRNRRALLDASVNAVPLAILVLFMGLFLAYDPWEPELLALAVAQALLLVPVVALFVATAVAVWLIGQDESPG